MSFVETCILVCLLSGSDPRNSFDHKLGQLKAVFPRPEVGYPLPASVHRNAVKETTANSIHHQPDCQPYCEANRYHENSGRGTQKQSLVHPEREAESRTILTGLSFVGPSWLASDI